MAQPRKRPRVSAKAAGRQLESHLVGNLRADGRTPPARLAALDQRLTHTLEGSRMVCQLGIVVNSGISM